MSGRKCWEINILDVFESNQFKMNRDETTHFTGTREAMVAHINELHRKTGLLHSGKEI